MITLSREGGGVCEPGMLNSAVPYYKDLSPYSYCTEDTISDPCKPYFAWFVPSHARTNVGWLSKRRLHTSGPSPDAFLPRLLDILAEQRVNQMRGFQTCELCPRGRANSQHQSIEHNGSLIWMGSGEIRVPHGTGEVFAAPTLIAPFVDHHNYRPPASFIEAVLAYPEGWLAGPDAPGVPHNAVRRNYTDPTTS